MNTTYQSLEPEEQEVYHQLRPALEKLENYKIEQEYAANPNDPDAVDMMSYIKNYVDASTTIIDEYIHYITDELRRYQNLYINTLKTKGHLRGDRLFYQQRAEISRRLRFSTQGFLRDLTLPDSNKNAAMHKIVGSVKSAERGWKLNGNFKGAFKQVHRYEQRLMHAAKQLSHFDKGLKGVDIGIVAHDTYRAYSTGRGAKVTARTAVTGTAGVVGGWNGAMLGGRFGAAGGSFFGPIGTAVGGIIGALIGALGLGYIYEKSSDFLFDYSEMLLNSQTRLIKQTYEICGNNYMCLMSTLRPGF